MPYIAANTKAITPLLLQLYTLALTPTGSRIVFNCRRPSMLSYRHFCRQTSPRQHRRRVPQCPSGCFSREHSLRSNITFMYGHVLPSDALELHNPQVPLLSREHQGRHPIIIALRHVHPSISQEPHDLQLPRASCEYQGRATGIAAVTDVRPTI